MAKSDRRRRALAARARESGRVKELDPVRPNAGLAASYCKRLQALVDEMATSVAYWITAAYRADPPEMAQDKSAAANLEEAVARLRGRWKKRFADTADALAAHYATAAAERSDATLQAALKKGGFSVRFRMTREANEVLQATIAEQVQLIRSIPEQHLAQVQGAVMRSVTEGRDLATLTRALREQHGVTRRRAANIARDQNNKATATMARARFAALGITKARWLHSGAGKHPRVEHVDFAAGRRGGPVYDVEKGAFLEGKWTWPGYEINCRCVSRPIIEALEGSS